MEYQCSLSLSGKDSTFNSSDFHELTHSCNGTSHLETLDPSTFFVQLVRLSVSLVVLLLLLTMYNMISVLDRLLLSTATCSLYWVAMVMFVASKSAAMMVFVPVQHKTKTTYGGDVDEDVGKAGFLVTAFLQSAATLALFLAIDHERQYRSSDYATVDTPTKHCVALTCSPRLLCSWPRLLAVILTFVPIGILIAIEILFTTSDSHTRVVLGFSYAYIITLPLARLWGMVVGVVMLVAPRSSKLAPSRFAGVCLMVGLVLSLMEDIPNFVTSCNRHSQGINECLLDVMTMFDLLQLLGVSSLLFFLLFVRSQYLRIEQESKLNLVWDLQKLLQVNGRKDIVRHYT